MEKGERYNSVRIRLYVPHKTHFQHLYGFAYFMAWCLDISLSNITRYWAQYKRKNTKTVLRLWIHKRLPFLVLTVEQWGIFYALFGEKIPRDIDCVPYNILRNSLNDMRLVAGWPFYQCRSFNLATHLSSRRQRKHGHPDEKSLCPRLIFFISAITLCIAISYATKIYFLNG